MILPLHIMLALLSTVFAAFMAFRPTTGRVRLHYGLAALTLGSGIWLTASSRGAMASACASGLAYLLVVTAAAVVARRKLIRRYRATYTATTE